MTVVDTFFNWIVSARMEWLVGLILLWSVLVRMAVGNVAGARLGLFAAPPVVLVTWVWILDLNLLHVGNAQVLAWWFVAAGFAVGGVLDLAKVNVRNALIISFVFVFVAVLVQGASMNQPSTLNFSPGALVAAWSSHGVRFVLILVALFVVVLRNHRRARGASVARYVSHFIFALGAAYLMRLQGFSPDVVLVVGLMAVHLVVPAVLGALEAGWLQTKNQMPTTRRPSYPGWSGILGLLVPMYFALWGHVSIAAQPEPGQIGLRAATLLSLLLLADLVIRPARTHGLHDLRTGVALGTRALYMATACALVLLAILAQQVQATAALS